MSLMFHPKPRMLLMCDFDTGFKPPEMVKKRPVVIVSPRRRNNNQLSIVVPLSTTKPEQIERYHHCLSPHSLPGKFSERETWAKCDMVTTVSLARLDRIYLGKDRKGKRLYVSDAVLSEDFQAIQRGVLAALGLDNLIFSSL